MFSKCESKGHCRLLGKPGVQVDLTIPDDDVVNMDVSGWRLSLCTLPVRITRLRRCHFPSFLAAHAILLESRAGLMTWTVAEIAAAPMLESLFENILRGAGPHEDVIMASPVQQIKDACSQTRVHSQERKGAVARSLACSRSERRIQNENRCGLTCPRAADHFLDCRMNFLDRAIQTADDA